jgi:hypothetical protein
MPEQETVILAEPADTIWLARTLAVNCVELTKVVDRAVEPKFTVQPETKFDPDALPVTVNVNPGPPAVTELGLRVIAGSTGDP